MAEETGVIPCCICARPVTEEIWMNGHAYHEKCLMGKWWTETPTGITPIMSSFTDPLDVRQVNSKTWKTLRDITFWTKCDESKPELPLQERCSLCITIPEGFETDFASVPSIVWPLIGHPAGRHAQAAVLHDWLYFKCDMPRKEADQIFAEAMEVLGVSYWKRTLMWAAVRVAGRLFYNKGTT